MKLGTAIAEIMRREGIEILCGYPVNHLIEQSDRSVIVFRTLWLATQHAHRHNARGTPRCSRRWSDRPLPLRRGLV